MLLRPKKIAVLLFCTFFSSCAHQALDSRPAPSETVAAISLLGDELVLDIASRSLISANKQAGLDIGTWNLNQKFVNSLEEGARAEGKAACPFSLDPVGLEKAHNVREDRWKKVVGRYNQALLDFLFREAEDRGISHFFLLTPLSAPPARFPRHNGTVGIFCSDQKDPLSRAYAYFSFDFSYWSVAGRKRIFQQEVNPGVTEQLIFAGCREVAELKDPVEALREPVHHTLELLVKGLFAKMGWEKAR